MCGSSGGSLNKKLIVLIGRRWFQKGPGNTYHDTEIIAQGFKGGILHHRTTMDYGYGDTYIQTGARWLEDQGVLKLERYSNGAVEPLWRYCQDHGIKLITSVVDVGSRKELKENA